MAKAKRRKTHRIIMDVAHEFPMTTVEFQVEYMREIEKIRNLFLKNTTTKHNGVSLSIKAKPKKVSE